MANLKEIINEYITKEGNKTTGEIINKTIRKASEHPVMVGTAAFLADFYLLDQKEILGIKIDAEHSSSLVGITTYTIFALLKNYVFNKQNPFKTASRTKLGNLEEIIENNKEIISLALGAAGYLFVPEPQRNDFFPTKYFALTAALSNTALTIKKAVRNIIVKYKPKNLKELIWNKILENPSVPAIASSLIIADQRINYLQNNLRQSRNSAIALSVPYAAILGWGIYSLLLGLSTILHTSRFQRPKKFASLEQTLTIENPHQRAIAQCSLAELSSKEKNMDLAIESFRISLKSHKNSKKNRTPFEFLLSLLNYHEIKQTIKTLKFNLAEEPSAEEAISQIHNYYLRNQTDSALKLAENSYEKFKNNLFFISYFASLKDALSLPSIKLWSEYLDSIKNWKPLAETQKTIIVPDDKMAKKCIIGKFYEKESEEDTEETLKKRLEEEHRKTLLAYSVIQDDSKVVKPVGIYSLEGKQILLLSHANGKPILSKDYEECIEEVIESAAELHKKLKESGIEKELELFALEYQTLRSLERLNIPEEQQKDFLQIYLQELTKHLPNKGPMHDDFHPGNILRCNYSGTYCAIDFEYLCNGNSAVDLFSLLDNNDYPIEERKKEKCIKLYNLLNPFASLGEFEEFYLYASIHKSLRLAGVTFHRSFTEDKSKSIAQQAAAKHYINKLKGLAEFLPKTNSLPEQLVQIADYWESQRQ